MNRNHRATHSGTCQICGARQLLPGGLLSLHGYTVRWGFFSGTCPGSKHLPFEQSTDRIAEAVKDAQITRTALEDKAQELTTLRPDVTRAYVHLYRKSDDRRRRSGYEWHQVELRRVEVPYRDGTGFYVKYEYDNPITEKVGALELYDSKPTLAETVLVLNTRRADGVERPHIKQLTRYIAWQEERIATWTPQPLIERKAS